MFSPEYIKLCTQPEVADRLQEEWEPKVGDWVVLKAKHAHKEPLLVIGTSWERDVVYLQGTPGRGRDIYNVIPLFQPRQIIEMLEERGLRYELKKGFDGLHYASAWSEEVEEIKAKGPDPATALLKAWLEVVKDE